MGYVIILLLICGAGAIIIKKDLFIGAGFLFFGAILSIYYCILKGKEKKEKNVAKQLQNGSDSQIVKNTTKNLLLHCSAVLRYVDSSSYGISIYNIVFPEVKSAVKSPTFQIETDVVSQSYSLLASISFRLLSTGEFHFYTGSLTETGKSIKNLFDCCLSWLRKNDKISEEEVKEIEKEMHRNIREVG